MRQDINDQENGAEKMSDQGNGGCLCGRIRLEIDGQPNAVLECHCKDCQKSSGGGPVLVALFPRDAVAIVQGELAGFSVVGDSGSDVLRRFCPNCGTPIYSELGKYPDLLAVKSGAWDTDPGFCPTTAIWTASAPLWHHVTKDIPTSPGSRG